MAVKPEQIKARLKVLFPKANLSQKRIDAIAAKLCLKPADDADDVAIDEVVNGANDFMAFEDIAREDDRMRTLEANQKAPAPTPEPTPAPTPNPTPDDAPAWAKALIDSNKKLADDLEVMKSGRITETKKATASELFAKSEVLKNMPEKARKNWENRIDVNSETAIEDQILGLETEYSELFQGSADTNSYAGPAGGGVINTKPNESEVEQIVSNYKI